MHDNVIEQVRNTFKKGLLGHKFFKDHTPERPSFTSNKQLVISNSAEDFVFRKLRLDGVIMEEKDQDKQD